MGTVRVLTQEEMEEIRDDMIVGATIDVSGHLILTQYDGSTIDAGYVKGSSTTEDTAATPSTLVKRTSTGTTKMAAPVATDDVAIKSTVDAALAAANSHADSITVRDDTKTEATLPGGYTAHVTITGSGTPNWPQNTVTVITHKSSDVRTTQMMIQKSTGYMWVRSSIDASTWGPSWVEYASTAYADAVGTSAPTPTTVVRRDGGGRFSAVAGSLPDHVIIKSTFDAMNLTKYGKINVQRFIASGTYTPSAGMITCIIEVQGGGGGGGTAPAAASGQASSASGGGGGCYVRSFFTAAEIGASRAVTIGAGGGAGVAGSPSSVGTLISANGGSPGLARGSNAAIYSGVDGGAGSSTASSTKTALVVPGSDGGSPFTGGTLGMSGSGGGSHFGGATTGRNTVSAGQSQPGNPGSLYGGGGSGGVVASTGAAAAGGTGGAGIVIITEFLDN